MLDYKEQSSFQGRLESAAKPCHTLHTCHIRGLTGTKTDAVYWYSTKLFTLIQMIYNDIILLDYLVNCSLIFYYSIILLFIVLTEHETFGQGSQDMTYVTVIVFVSDDQLQI